METTAERDLVIRLKEKSSDAFEELVNSYARRLYSASYRVLRNQQDAEDAVQNTFLKAFQNIAGFREESSLYSWLFRIVTNESLQKIRGQKSRETVPIEPYLPRFEGGQHTEAVAGWSETPEQSFEAAQLEEFVEQCIDELPEDYRIAYILKDIEQLSEDRVSEILGISNPAMKNRVHRARLVIRKRVEDQFFKKSRKRA